jgi:hypothetical protein
VKRDGASRHDAGEVRSAAIGRTVAAMQQAQGRQALHLTIADGELSLARDAAAIARKGGARRL